MMLATRQAWIWPAHLGRCGCMGSARVRGRFRHEGARASPAKQQGAVRECVHRWKEKKSNRATPAHTLSACVKVSECVFSTACASGAVDDDARCESADAAASTASDVAISQRRRRPPGNQNPDIRSKEAHHLRMLPPAQKTHKKQKLFRRCCRDSHKINQGEGAELASAVAQPWHGPCC